MSLIVFQHEPTETPSELGKTLVDHGHKLKVVHLYKGDAIPPDLDNVDGIISLGGNMNVGDDADHPWLPGEMAYIKQAHEAGLGVVGICLGAQLVATALGGKVEAMETPEAGWAGVKLAFPGTIDPIYSGITWDSVQFHLHGQEVKELPPGATPLSGSKACRTQAFKVGFRTYGFQYHFEWNAEQIRAFSTNPLVEKAGESAAKIAEGTNKFYDKYRRQGDRLCETITSLLYPINKRY